MIFVSLSVYSLAKELGPDNAVAEVHRQLAAAATDQVEDYLPAVKVIARLRLLDSVALRIDAGATVIAKARSRAFHSALFENVEADVWISVDDDVDATKQTLEWLVEAVRERQTGAELERVPGPRICLAPYLLRNSKTQVETLSVDLPQVFMHRHLSGGGRVRTATSGGFGLVALNRAAIEAIARHWGNAAPLESLHWRDDDGKNKLAIFREELSDGRWYGEDLSFFRRVPRGVDVEALCTGITSHAGEVLRLETVPALQQAPF